MARFPARFLLFGATVVVLTGASIFGVAVASAEPLCTDSWVGPSEGSWGSAGDWSSGVPTSSSVVCIGAGKSVTAREEVAYAGVLEDAGGLTVEFGWLDLTNTLEPSSVGVLTMEEGNLAGPASLSVKTSLTWGDHGTIYGGGSLVIGPGASGSVNNSIKITEAAKLVNEGTFTLNSGSSITLSEDAKIENAGTFDENSDISGYALEESGIGGHFINTGTFQTELTGTGRGKIDLENFENKGTVDAKAGILAFFKSVAPGGGKWMGDEGHILFTEGTFAFTSGEWSGSIVIEGGEVSAENVNGTHAQVTVFTDSFSVASGTMTVESLAVDSFFSTLSGAGTLVVTKNLHLESSRITGSGSLILDSSGSGIITGGISVTEHRLVNDGNIEMPDNFLSLIKGAVLENRGVFTANDKTGSGFGEPKSGEIINAGLFQVTVEAHVVVNVAFVNRGAINEENEGHFEFLEPALPEGSTQEGGPGNPSRPGQPCPICGDPVVAATGDLVETQTDLAVPGRGVGLNLTRTYNSEAAVAKEKGIFGYGWDNSFGDYLELLRTIDAGGPDERLELRLHQGTGATVTLTYFPKTHSSEAVGSQDRLQVVEGEGAIITLPDQTKYKFSCACSTHSRLESIADRNGNTTTLSYDEHGRLDMITDPSGRKLKLSYNEEGLVEQVEDPMKHVSKYTYEEGNLTSVTLPGEGSPRWRFKYNGSHELTEMTDARGNKTTNEYSEGRVVAQTDPAGRTLKFEYEPFQTRITNETTKGLTIERFTSNDEPSSITRGFGTGYVTTKSFTYNEEGYITSETNGDDQTTKYEYDTEDNRTRMVDPDHHETTWEYDSTHDVTEVTDPNGEKTTIERDSHGNPVTVSRSAPKGETQTSKYKYAGDGELESMTDPDGHEWKYEYDGYGDRTAEIDPEGDKRTWEYNEDSQETRSVSPRGNVPGGEPSKYQTSVERDAQGRVVAVTTPEAHGGGRPVIRSAASVSGMVLEGQTLTASTGLWGGSPSSFSYQWQGCDAMGVECFDVGGATEPTLHLTEAAGFTVRVVVTAHNSYGTASSTSARTAVIGSVAQPVFAGAFGSAGEDDGEFSRPVGVAVDAHGDVWVVDSFANRLEKFSSSGSWIASYGGFGSGSGQFEEPVSVAVNRSTGDVYVTDLANRRVDELTESGEWVRSWKGGEGEFGEANGIAVDSKGNVWVTDYSNDDVEEFTGEGVFVRKFGTSGSGDGEFEGPSGIVVANGLVYVADLNNARLEAFSETGTYEGQGGGPGIEAGEFRFPAGLAANSSGNIFVADLGNDRVQEFAPYGEFLTAFGMSGSGEGELSEPEEIATGPSGEIYVTDAGNDRVEKWEPAGAPADVARPAIGGQLVSGQTLTATEGEWTGSPPPTYGYQWQRCSLARSECANISGASESTYKLESSDVGKTIRLKVTATSTSGTTEAFSPVSGPIEGNRTTRYSYDADGNLETTTSPDGATTKYTYNAENEPTKVEEPDGATTETSYDSEGQVVKQTNGSKQVTEYVRNILGQVTESIDPLKHKTSYEYDAAGNLVKLTDPTGRTTTNVYDPAGRLTETKYSGESSHTTKYEYDADGLPTKMTDATGETTYTYDQLDRLTETKNGHGETVGYEYNLDDQPTKITYPNGKSVTRAYDHDGRLHSITDWLAGTTSFSYDPDSDLTAISFPEASGDHDNYSYNEADEPTETTISKGSETLATLDYAHNNEAQVQAESTNGLPGEENTGYEYDPAGRLTQAGTTDYEYNQANDPTKLGSLSNTYDAASELETTATTKYTYNEDGQRTKTTPASGPATSYSYDQAGDLTRVTRPKEGSTPAVEDTYTSNASGLRTSETISSTTNHLAWDEAEQLPLLLSSGTYSFIYGPDDTPVEQINNTTGTVTYLHHDQAGSTRLLTGSTGTVTGKCTYGAYGTPTCEGTSTTPLGYDAQYTSTDTGLIYLRNRVYDPATAQFLTVDPLVSISGAPYSYAGDNPLSYGDAVGLLWTPLAGGAGGADAACGATIEIPGVDIGTCGAAGIATGAAVIGAGISLITGEEAGNDEGEAELKAKEAERENCGDPTQPPGEGWVWKGNGEPGSEEGSWFNEETREYLHPDFKPSSHGPHYDYRGEDGTEYRIYPDGRIEPKRP